MFKIALTAGHYRYTAGKHCMGKLDPNKTREWVLNDRIADKIEKLLSEYEGYQLLRTDDTTGEKAIEVIDRVKAANNFKADFYLSIHHNAGIYGGKGGGIVAYTCKKCQAKSSEWQKDLYNALIKKTGLKGNRATPLAQANFDEVKKTTMPAVLLELGFMDSATDVPVILTEAYANKCAEAIVEVIVARGGLKKKPVQAPASTTTGKTIYRVQCGAYSVKANAEALQKKLKAAGFDAIIKVEQQ